MVKNISEVVEFLGNGGLVCIATDTLFALSCDATNQSAVEKLYQTKKRDREKKLPVLFHSIDHILEYCELPQVAYNLAKKFWPGKLTIILNLKLHALDHNIFGNTIAARIPGSNEVLEIIKGLNRPIIGTSANISGCNNLTTIDEIEAQFSGSEVRIFKGNTTISGIQSTIISIDNGKINLVREGAIASEEMFSSLDCNINT